LSCLLLGIHPLSLQVAFNIISGACSPKQVSTQALESCLLLTKSSSLCLSWLLLGILLLSLQVAFYTISGARSPKQVSFGPELEAEGVSHVAMYAGTFDRMLTEC
jgi:hypothetical protein